MINGQVTLTTNDSYSLAKTFFSICQYNHLIP